MEKGHAIALEIPFTERLSILYDFYWRLYDTYIPEMRELDQVTYELRYVKRLPLLVKLSGIFGLPKKNGHYFSLYYINTI